LNTRRNAPGAKPSHGRQIHFGQEFRQETRQLGTSDDRREPFTLPDVAAARAAGRIDPHGGTTEEAV
jgi:hypothetical protein